MCAQGCKPMFSRSPRHIARVLSSIAFITLWIIGCSGGGGGDASSAPGNDSNTYEMSRNKFIKYVGGEDLDYSYTYTAVYNDGSVAVDIAGFESKQIYANWVSARHDYMLYKVIQTAEFDGMSTATPSFWFYDDSDNFVQYLVGSDNYYAANGDNPDEGALLFPHSLSAGNSWTNKSHRVEFDGEIHTGSTSYIVTGRETIAIPFGRIETYKVTYNGSYTSGSFFDLTISGTYWVHPDIGPVKIREIGNYGYGTKYTYNTELTGINWTHYSEMPSNTTNRDPIAKAGPDQSVIAGVTVTLHGNGSTDADGDELSYSWEMTTWPPNSNTFLEDEASSSPSFVADVAGEYSIQLIVEDGTSDSLPDSVTVTTKTPISDKEVEPNDSRRTANFIGLKSDYTGQLHSSSDDDYYSTFLYPGTFAVTIQPAGAVTDDGEFDIKIEDSKGNRLSAKSVSFSTYSLDPVTIEASINTAGVYYFFVGYDPESYPSITFPTTDDYLFSAQLN